LEVKRRKTGKGNQINFSRILYMMENFGDPKGAEQPFLGIAYAQPSGYLYWYKPNPKKGNTFPCPSGPSSFI
jgi:hypothetical protein